MARTVKQQESSGRTSAKAQAAMHPRRTSLDLWNGGEWGIRTPGTGFPVQRFSKPSPSATRPTLQRCCGLRLGNYSAREEVCIEAYPHSPLVITKLFKADVLGCRNLERLHRERCSISRKHLDQPGRITSAEKRSISSSCGLDWRSTRSHPTLAKSARRCRTFSGVPMKPERRPRFETE